MAKSVRMLVAALFLADAAALLGVQGLLTAAGFSLRDDVSAGILAGLVLALAAGQLAALAIAGAYRRDVLFAGHHEYAAVATGISGAALAAVAAAYLGNGDFSRPAFLLTWALSVAVLGALRFGARRLVYRLRHHGLFVERVLVVGADAYGLAVARHMNAPLEHGLKVVGFLDDYRSLGSPVTDGLAVLAEPRALLQVARREGISRVVIVPQALSWESMRDILETAARDGGLRMQMAPALHQLLAWSRHPVQAGPIPLTELENLSIRGWNAVVKRALDVTLASMLLPALAAELALTWACARLDGGGPLIRRQTAVGRRGQPLPLLTLAPPKAAEPAGRLLRSAWRLRWALARGRWSKLPNLVNVLLGRMSLVGPRALPKVPTKGSDAAGGAPLGTGISEVDDTWVLALSSVRPGLTGPTAADGCAASADFGETSARPRPEASPELSRTARSEGAVEPLSRAEEQAVRDVAYIRDYSLWLDLRLLFASARRAMRRERALPISYPAPAFGPVAADSRQEAP